MLVDFIKNIRWRRQKFIIVLFAISIIFFVICYGRFKHAQSEYQEALSQLNVQKSNNAFAQDQLSLFKRINPYYQHLVDEGIVGESRRLQWLETLQDASAALGIPKINFTLSNARRAKQENDYYWSDRFVFEKTLLTVNFELLHEGDFYNFLNYFSDKSQGLFSVERCELKRMDVNQKKEFNGLDGLCELEAYSFVSVRVENIVESDFKDETIDYQNIHLSEVNAHLDDFSK